MRGLQVHAPGGFEIRVGLDFKFEISDFRAVTTFEISDSRFQIPERSAHSRVQIQNFRFQGGHDI